MRIILTSILALAAIGAVDPAKIPGDDIILRAMNDEMHRSVSRLKLEGHKSPYFISYRLRQDDKLDLVASFGAIDTDDHRRDRSLSVDVREGDYHFDSADARSLTHFNSQPITNDDNYDAIRQALWLRTDEAYKKAIEQLAGKTAFLKQHKVQDLPESMTKEDALIHIEPPIQITTDEAKYKELVRRLSRVLSSYPQITSSQVKLNEADSVCWFVNSEGSCNRRNKTVCTLTAVATAHSDQDLVTDNETISVKDSSELPSYEDLEKRMRNLAQRLTDLVKSPKAEQYRGPVLFEGLAAAQFLSQGLEPNLGHTPEPLDTDNPFNMMMKNPLQDRVGTRVMPAFVSVVDDPSNAAFAGVHGPSAFAVDDDGVKAQTVTLIDKGILKNLAMSRLPSKDVKHSNGHAYGFGGVARNLLVTTSAPVPLDQLKQKLIELGKEDGLTEVYIVRGLADMSSAMQNPKSMITSVMQGFTSGSRMLVLPPVLLYRVSVADGKETLVRGLQFANMTIRTLRDIDSLGNDSKPYHLNTMLDIMHGPGSLDAATIATPSILIKEIELQKSDQKNEIPPILKNPNFDSPTH